MPAHQECPGCGHHTSQWVGGGCTVLIPSTEDEIAAGAPWVRYCNCDCSIMVQGESQYDRLVRALWAGTDREKP